MELRHYVLIRKHVIINADEVDSIDFGQVLETSLDTLRYNLDESKTFVKFNGGTPSFLNGKTQYTHSELMDILQDQSQGWQNM